MSTFASVLRKPGQKITPRAAPRRNVQRQAQKAAAAANLNALTPEGADDISNEAVAATSQVDAAPSTIQDDSSHGPLPTPPDTAEEQPSPPPETTLEAVRIPSREHSQSVPPVVIEEPQTRAGAKRKTNPGADNDAATTGRSAEAVRKETATAAPAPKPRPNKRRKVAPQGAPSYLLARSQDAPHPGPDAALTAPTLKPTKPSRRSTSRQSQRDASGIQDLLQRSRNGLSTVSQLSRSIDRDSERSLRSRSRRQSTALPDVQDEEEEDQDFQPSNRMAALATAVLEPAAPPRGRKRYRKGQTPENPENYEIDPDEVQMSQLTRDSGLGKRSETGRRLDTEWTEIKARWDAVAEKNREEAMKNRAKEKEKHKKAKSVLLEDADVARPKHLEMKIVNGQLVVEQEDREEDFHQDMHIAAEEEAQADEPIYRYVNSNRIGKKAGRIGGPQARWDQENTDLFYKGLRMFGTDFEMIANMLFPGKTRKEIKDKFVREERSNHDRIIENTRQREEINLEELMKDNEMGELKDPDQVMRELEADEERLRKQYEEKRALENGEVIQLNDEADLPIPSIEVDGVEGEEEEAAEGEEEEPQLQPRGTELESVSVRAVESVRPKQRKPRQPRRTTRDTSKAKANRKGKKPLEGVEERIGTIDDVER